MDTWTQQLGYPVVQVSRNYSQSTAVLTQKRYLLRPEANSSESYAWWVPVSYKIRTGSTIRTWLAPDVSLQINNVTPLQWILVNIDEKGIQIELVNSLC